LNKARIGQTVEVLIEGNDETGLFGRSFAEAPDVDGVIHLPYRSGIKAGQYIKVKLLESDDYDMTGGYLP
ncbi:MAG: 30S ribosomal protein S12 methylthiotransferase RimO, partial [Clostridiales bacterium]|nr:30S ribosomal protein S12 methylthiotransferase RimO [Clostridiales bacterium]MCR5073849.1 30S ribosomal protein S12 methylthiotransferase RimO [Clostridiales bacterium]